MTEDLTEDLTEVDQKVGMSRNRVVSSTDKRGHRAARPNEDQGPNEKRPRKTQPQSPFGAP